MIVVSCIAAFQGYSDIVAVLLAAGADMEKKNFGEVALTLAVSQGHFHTVKLLLDYGADINKLADDGKTPLVKAIAANYPEICQILLEKGANVNLQNSAGGHCFNVGCS